MATISERLAYILTADNKQFVHSFQQAGAAADKELGKADSRLDKLGGNLTKVGAGAVAFAGIAGAGLVKVAMGASNLAESVNAVNVTFGDAAEGILKLGEEAATAVGLSKAEFNGLAVQFSSFAETVAGKGGDVVGTMDTLTTRVADFASVMNLDVPEAARIFQSALAGETEPIKKFGIDLSAASVAAFAVANGIAASASEMTEAQKTQARYGLLMESTNKTAGDFANTSDGLANQQRILKAELKNLSDGIGTGVLPMLTAVVSTAGKAIHAFAELSPATQAAVGKFAALGVAGVGMLGTLSLVAGQVIKMRDRFTTLGDDGVRSLNNMGKAARGLGIAMAIAAAALVVYSVNAIQNAGSSEKAADAMQELSRVADEALGQTLLRVLSQSLFAGEDLNVTLGKLAESNLEGAMRARDNAEAMGLGVEVTTALNAAIDAEIAARKQEAKTVKDATDAVDDNTLAHAGLKQEMEGGISTSEVAEQAGKALADQHEASADAADAQREALAELTAEMIDALGSTFDLEKANLNLQTAYAAYQANVLATTAIVNDSTLSDREKEQALRDLRGEEISLAESALATAKAYAQEKGAADGSAQSAQFQKDKLFELAAAFPELREEIQIYIDKLNAVPDVVKTRFEITASGATITPHGDLIGVRPSGGSNVVGATGGIVTRPTVALIGEAGPEAVVPLDQTPGSSPLNGDGLGGSNVTNNYVTVYAGMGADGREIGDVLVGKLREYERRNGNGWRS